MTSDADLPYPDLPYPVPEAHEVLDEPPLGLRAAAEQAEADIAAGLYVVCDSYAAFDALLAELAHAESKAG